MNRKPDYKEIMYGLWALALTFILVHAAGKAVFTYLIK